MRTLALLFALATTGADAAQPESGWWWNAAETGRGFTIEVQNNTLFMAGYLYTSTGAPIWYTAAGPYDHTASSFTGQLVEYAGGQCLTCPYRPTTPVSSPGNVQLRFTSPTAGTLTWPGGAVPITRHLYGVQSDHRRLAGRWVYTSVVSSIASADWVTFDQTTMSNGTLYVAGTIQGGRVAVGGFLQGSYSVLIDSSTSFYSLFICPQAAAGVEHLADCREWLYLKGSNPTGNGNLAHAFKFAPAPITIPSNSTPTDTKTISLVDELNRVVEQVNSATTR